MRDVYLVPMKVFYISFGAMAFFRSYRLPEASYGDELIYYGILPGYYFNIFDKECGNCIPEVMQLAKNNNRNVYSFINQVIKKTSNSRLQIYPHLGNTKKLFFIVTVYWKEGRLMPLEKFNLDSCWSKLTADEIADLLRKSHRR